ncbi:MAG: hypothetical protein ACO3EH_00305 [Ilumatobacteraceae bacterium]
MKITIKDARELQNALINITSGNKTVVTKDNATAQVPYELDDKTRWNLTKNLGLVERVVKNAETAREGIIRELSGGTGNINRETDPVKFDEAVRRIGTLEATVESLPLVRVKMSGLRVSTTNPIPGILISALRPILEDDITVEASEVIPD